MAKVYIGFSYPKEFKLGAASIAWWIEKSYSHVYLRFEYLNSKDAIFHAAHGMIHFRSVDNFKRDNDVIKEYEIELTQLEHDNFFDDCMDLAGEVYGTIELPKILISDIVLHAFNREIRWKNGKGYICSELVGKFCIEKLKIAFNKPVFLLKPSDIDSALEGRYALVAS
jgi:hypothetical protein